jgi:hypothetical protein
MHQAALASNGHLPALFLHAACEEQEEVDVEPQADSDDDSDGLGVEVF